MKYIISIGLTLFISFLIFIYGFRVGKMTVEKLNNDKVVYATANIKDDTVELKKELLDLRKKLREVKNEECNYILSYPVKSRCLQNK